VDYGVVIENKEVQCKKKIAEFKQDLE